MSQEETRVLVTDAAGKAADPAFVTAAHSLLASLVLDGAALGWVEPPSLAEVTALLGSVAAAARAGDGALRAAYATAAPVPATHAPGPSAAAPSAAAPSAAAPADMSATIAPPVPAPAAEARGGHTTGAQQPEWLPEERLVGLGYWTRYVRPTHSPHADVRRIAVAAEAQGRGVGRALTSALIDAARDAGIEVLTLDARGDNTSALRLYQRLGFAEYGRLRDFVAVGSRRYDMVLCALDLRVPTAPPAQHPTGQQQAPGRQATGQP